MTFPVLWAIEYQAVIYQALLVKFPSFSRSWDKKYPYAEEIKARFINPSQLASWLFYFSGQTCVMAYSLRFLQLIIH
jgi:hypothetical protein